MSIYGYYTSGVLKKDALGNILFFPYGVLGRGYVAPAGKMRGIDLLLKCFLIIQLLLPLAFIWIIHTEWLVVWIASNKHAYFLLWGFAASLEFIPFVFFAALSNRITQHLDISSEKMSLSDISANASRNCNIIALLLLTFISLAFSVLWICLLILMIVQLSATPGWVVFKVACVVFALYCDYIYFKMLKAKRRVASSA